jgi:hypothetical protein
VVPFFVHFFDGSGRKITPRILCWLAQRDDEMDNMGDAGFEKRP